MWLKSSPNTDFQLNWVNVISFSLVSIISDTTWQLMVIIQLNISFSLSKNGISHHMVYFFSFLLDCIFYSTYVPWFESNIKPLLRFQRLYHRQSLPIFVWSLTLIDLFENYKTNLIIPSLLVRYDNSKPTCLKIDWSTSGRGYIIIQPNNFTRVFSTGYTLTVYWGRYIRSYIIWSSSYLCLL